MAVCHFNGQYIIESNIRSRMPRVIIYISRKTSQVEIWQKFQKQRLLREAYAIPYSVSPCRSVFGLARAST